MPKGRAVVLASGARPTLIRTQPWMTGPHADAVQASITAHDPQAPRTIDEAQRELAHAQELWNQAGDDQERYDDANAAARVAEEKISAAQVK